VAAYVKALERIGEMGNLALLSTYVIREIALTLQCTSTSTRHIFARRALVSVASRKSQSHTRKFTILVNDVTAESDCLLAEAIQPRNVNNRMTRLRGCASALQNTA